MASSRAANAKVTGRLGPSPVKFTFSSTFSFHANTTLLHSCFSFFFCILYFVVVVYAAQDPDRCIKLAVMPFIYFILKIPVNGTASVAVVVALLP